MRCHPVALLSASALALLAASLFVSGATAQTPNNFYYYSGGIQTPLIPFGQDDQGRPIFQTLGSTDKSGAAVPGNFLTLTNQFVIQPAPSANGASTVQLPGATLSQQFDLNSGLRLYDASSPYDALNLANAAFESGAAIYAEPEFAQQQSKRDVPNDPLFANQWHLRNTGQSGGTVNADINVVPWWNFAGGTHQGSGVNIAVVDDGLQYTHPDLAANYKPNLSRDINFNDADPSPTVTADFHGTSVAGVAAGRGNNGVGVSGVAPLAGLAGVRLIAAAATDAQEAQGLTYQNNNQSGFGTNSIYSNSWGPADDGGTLEAPGAVTKAAFANAVATGRGGKGSIFTWAGGNGLQSFDNSNYDGYANSRYVIAVAATNNDANGSQSYYSEPGANLLVNAPSSGGTLDITTTDLVGANGYDASDYTNTFGGTSSATPVVSGAVALMLEVNPNLGWRDVKHILVNTAQKNDPTNTGWTNNAAGHHINHAYGFGRIDATAAATLASTWTNVPSEVVVISQSPTLNLAIPDGISSGYSANPTYGAAVSSSLMINSPIRVETVEITVNATHPYRGDLQFILTAPTGTQSLLGNLRPDSGDNYTNWVFTTVRDWDEMATGLWTLSVRDGYIADVGIFNSWKIAIYGTPVPEPSTMALIAISLAGLSSCRRPRRLAAER